MDTVFGTQQTGEWDGRVQKQRSKTGFLSLSTIDIWLDNPQWWGCLCIVGCLTIPGLYELDTNYTQLPPPKVGQPKMSPGTDKCPLGSKTAPPHFRDRFCYFHEDARIFQIEGSRQIYCIHYGPWGWDCELFLVLGGHQPGLPWRFSG